MEKAKTIPVSAETIQKIYDALCYDTQIEANAYSFLQEFRENLKKKDLLKGTLYFDDAYRTLRDKAHSSSEWVAIMRELLEKVKKE